MQIVHIKFSSQKNSREVSTVFKHPTAYDATQIQFKIRFKCHSHWQSAPKAWESKSMRSKIFYSFVFENLRQPNMNVTYDIWLSAHAKFL